MLVCTPSIFAQSIQVSLGPRCACHPAPYRVKVFPWIARYGINGHTINTGTFAICSHFFESLPNFPSLNRLRLLFLVKNHTQFSLSCYSIRNVFMWSPSLLSRYLRVSWLLRLHPPLKGTSVFRTCHFRLSSFFLIHFLSGSHVP
jgi:hypothetical protein